MNCDLVFEILTRGPFPSGEPTDVSVELHLARCHDCRQLAEALRPAVALFHESLTEGHGAESLPGYYGALEESERPHPTAVAAAPRPRAPWLEPPELAPRVKRGWLRQATHIGGGMFLGAALAVMAAILVAQGPSMPERSSQSPPRSTQHAVLAARGAGDLRATLAALHLPAACLQASNEAHGETRPRAATGAESLLCCTHCHSAGKANRPAVAATAILQREACLACHAWD